MSNELIKKAYEHFNGVWPYKDFNNMIVSTNSNDKCGAGHYKYFGRSEKCFNSLIDGERWWQWVGTKADFEAYGEKLRKEAPKGATHYNHRANTYPWYKIDGNTCYHITDYGLQPCDFAEADFILLKKTDHERWVPAVGKECECSWLELPDGGSCEWRIVIYKGFYKDRHWFGDDACDVVIGSDYCEFRPIKTSAI